MIRNGRGPKKERTAMLALVVEGTALLLALVGFIAAAATEVNYIRNHRSFSGEPRRPKSEPAAIRDPAPIAAE
jgi:hypothetical protein